MKEVVQFLADAIARWGTMLLLALALVPILRGWRLWQRRTALTRGKFYWGLGRAAWLFATLLILAWVIQGPMAPLTRSLVSLQEARGESIPDLAFHSLPDNARHQLSEYRGRVVLLNLWGTFCPPCIRELPELARLQSDFAERGVTVLALSDEPRETVERFLKRHPMDLTIGYTPSFEWLKVESFRPFTLVIDRQGVLRGHHFGDLDYAGFEQMIRPWL